MMDFGQQLARFVAPLKQRVTLMVGRAIINLVDDAKKMQAVQIALQADVVRSKVERMQEYGFTSVPDAGCEALVVMVGGNTAHPVVVATDDRRYRPKGLAKGDVALYRMQDGVLVKLLTGGFVELGPSPSQYVALANLVKTEVEKAITYTTGVKTALQAGLAAVVPSDGGATAITTTISNFPVAPTIVAPAATKVKAK